MSILLCYFALDVQRLFRIAQLQQERGIELGKCCTGDAGRKLSRFPRPADPPETTHPQSSRRPGRTRCTALSHWIGQPSGQRRHERRSGQPGLPPIDVVWPSSDHRVLGPGPPWTYAQQAGSLLFCDRPWQPAPANPGLLDPPPPAWSASLPSRPKAGRCIDSAVGSRCRGVATTDPGIVLVGGALPSSAI